MGVIGARLLLCICVYDCTGQPCWSLDWAELSVIFCFPYFWYGNWDLLLNFVHGVYVYLFCIVYGDEEKLGLLFLGLCFVLIFWWWD